MLHDRDVHHSIDELRPRYLCSLLHPQAELFINRRGDVEPQEFSNLDSDGGVLTHVKISRTCQAVRLTRCSHHSSRQLSRLQHETAVALTVCDHSNEQRAFPTQPSPQHNHHCSDTQLKQRLFCSTCIWLSRPCCRRPPRSC